MRSRRWRAPSQNVVRITGARRIEIACHRTTLAWAEACCPQLPYCQLRPQSRDHRICAHYFAECAHAVKIEVTKTGIVFAQIPPRAFESALSTRQRILRRLLDACMDWALHRTDRLGPYSQERPGCSTRTPQPGHRRLNKKNRHYPRVDKRALAAARRHYVVF